MLRSKLWQRTPSTHSESKLVVARTGSGIDIKREDAEPRASVLPPARDKTGAMPIIRECRAHKRLELEIDTLRKVVGRRWRGG